MLKNYLKIAYRNLIKTKLFSAINIFGLSIGMAACLLILHYVNFERSYDQLHSKIDQIYRLRYERISENGSAVRFASCTPPAGALIRERFPEVDKLARVFRYRGVVVSHQDIKFTEERVFHAEPEFVDIFDFKFIKGDPKKALGGVDNALISQSIARKYFGTDDPVGKILKVDQKTAYQVAGIFEDIPKNSHIKFDFLLSFENFDKSSGPDYMENWGHTGMFTYLILKQDADLSEFNRRIAVLIDAEFGEALKYYNMKMLLPLQPVRDIHLISHYMQEFEVNGDGNAVNFLFIIALFIIVIAWVNYINLSTARSLTRAREVGLRKTVGGSRQQLMIQFLIETIVLNLISLLLAIVLLQLSLPFFSQLTGTPLSFQFWVQPWVWAALPALFFVGVLLSGLYPVFKLSSFDPIATLRGKIGTSVKGISFRKSLVVFQYAMAIALITSTLAVYNQINFMQNQTLGFDSNQILVVKAPRVKDETFGEKIITFKNSLRTESNIEKICMVTEVPGKQLYWDNGGIMKAGEDANKGKNYLIVGIDYDFSEVFNVKFVAGRNFSKERAADTDALIFNETAVQWMGFESVESAIGQKVDYWGKIYTLIGVLKDYHQQSPKQTFVPQIFRLMPEGRHNLGLFAIKIKTGNIHETVSMVQDYYDNIFAGNPFDYFFLDEYFDQQYKADVLFGRVFGIFAILAILVTSIGILGLIAFVVTQRTKEIGIRKVLGADIRQVLNLLTLDILKLIIISFIVVTPLMYWGIVEWLQTYANQMDISVDLFLFPLLLTLIITFTTIGMHVIRAALANPVEALRYE
jgi:putative ABC transport system permease protein